MKIKPGYMLRQVAGENVVLPVSGETAFNGMITLNETGCVLWKRLEEGAELPELMAALTSEFEVDEATAEYHAEAFTNRLKELNILA